MVPGWDGLSGPGRTAPARKPQEFRKTPMNGDAMGIFASREAAEEFIAGDPFAVHGVVTNWTMRPWNEVLQTGP